MATPLRCGIQNAPNASGARGSTCSSVVPILKRRRGHSAIWGPQSTLIWERLNATTCGGSGNEGLDRRGRLFG